MNGKVRLALGVVGGGLGLVAVVAAGAFLWVNSTANARMNQHFESHEVDFPIPFPLSEEELAELRTERLAALSVDGAEPVDPPEDPLEGVDLDALAKERALERGKHLVEAIYVCVECHGEDFGGGEMINDPAVGQVFGPNLTTGKGSKTIDYTPADWDRIVRHGILPDGRAAPMPSVDFFSMSDRELSDIVAYIRSFPPVDKELPPVTLGPVGKLLMAGGIMLMSAEMLPDHHADHAELPPSPSEGLVYGKHLAQVCTGCHRPDFSGGPVPGGPPDWAPASNLTPAGLADWTWEQFDTAMRTGKKPDGADFLVPMDGTVPFAKKMKEEELKAIWEYLQSLPAVETKG